MNEVRLESQSPEGQGKRMSVRNNECDIVFDLVSTNKLTLGLHFKVGVVNSIKWCSEVTKDEDGKVSTGLASRSKIALTRTNSVKSWQKADGIFLNPKK